jgi:hypothetical protein
VNACQQTTCQQLRAERNDFFALGKLSSPYRKKNRRFMIICDNLAPFFADTRN